MTILTEVQRRLLRTILERGAEGASQALSRWLGEEVRLVLGEVEQIELEEAAEALGPPESLVAACRMGLVGPIGGSLLLCFEDHAGLALVDLLLHQPVGTTTEWGEVEQSAAMETTNIVGCAYLNALASHLPSSLGAGSSAMSTAGELAPTPPVFFHEFAGSLLQFALMDQAQELDRVLLVRTNFELGGDGAGLDWTLLFVPDAPSLAAMASALTDGNAS
ncbi:chemotaxis protein CheC [Paludisphaera mucosa]|uniref:Chemotaxis protein CheC n=1 Tax=Paludisphaera mucosa TaxID=3030827 RepID=A0ABT6FKY5_9BACT|nr:chemotaxis protein CheC [Paludisphaera mucosa]MDG3008243.1 chemotaxis protein CheC [Paludisphaera mucosa]